VSSPVQAQAKACGYIHQLSFELELPNLSAQSNGKGKFDGFEDD
jgi:hypothetical protein